MSDVIKDDEAREYIKANLNRILEEQAITRYRLAKMTGESEQAIKSVADGAHVPRVSLLARIAEALGVTIDALIQGPPEIHKKKSAKKLQEVA